MLNGKLIAVAAAIAILGMGSQAGAYTIDLNGGDITPQGPSNVLVFTNTATLTPGESYTTWQWTLGCTGCQMVNFTYNEFAPGLMWWNNQVYGAPVPTINTGSTIFNIGGYGSSWTGAVSPTFVVGWVTVHVTATAGTVTPFLANIGEGFATGGVIAPISGITGATWVPEPGTAMLLALGLSGLGMMGRRNR